MQGALVIRTLGIFLLLFSTALLPPLGISLIYRDGEADHLGLSLLITLGLGLALWLPTIRVREVLRNRDAFVIVSLLWVAMSLLGAVPFVLGFGMRPVDAVFESVSGFTTTGATVIVGLDVLPPSILFFRQEIQWLGGIGVVVSAIALLPLLGVGGMQLFKAETPGPMKDDKLTPRIAHTAGVLWRLYLGVTLLCAAGYWAAGMSWFDAVAHSLTTVSTGGFSTYDASFSQFDSALIEAIAIVFMLVGGINFGVHYLVWHARSPRAYWQSTEVRTFLVIVAVLILVTSVVLYHEGEQPSVAAAVRYAAFTGASIITSTGYGIEDFSLWPTLLPVLLIFASFIGGCAGSTAGGMKVIRFVVLGKQVGIEFQRLVHPSHVKPLKVGRQTIPPRTVEAVWAFFGVYVGVFALFMLLMMGEGLDQVSAFGAVATCMNNVGPGLGEVSANFASVSDAVKWLAAAAMLLGRLEIFTLLVLFTPGFWRD
jgi:trk system potassium uptake protein TrkH